MITGLTISIVYTIVVSLLGIAGYLITSSPRVGVFYTLMGTAYFGSETGDFLMSSIFWLTLLAGALYTASIVFGKMGGSNE